MLATPKGKSQLFLASSLCDGLEDNNMKQVATLLQVKEANPNVLIPSQGITPFHLVIGNDCETFAEEVTKLFLRHGGNPNIRSVDGMTPVHVAAAWGRIKVLEILLAHGGNPLSLDDDGCSPFHYAYDGAYYDAIAVLGKYCGDEDEIDNDKPKYRLTLEKIRINKGDIVEEYVVSDTSEDEVKSATNMTSFVSPQDANRNTHDTITTDGEASPVRSFVTLRRHQLCLPKTKETRVSKAIDMTDIDFHQVDRSVEDEKLLVNKIINRLSASFTDNSPIVYDSFDVPVKVEGERMPRISSPKNDIYVPHTKSAKVPTKLIETKRVQTPQSVRKKTGTQFSHKIPLKIESRKKSESVQKKTPCSISSNLRTPRNKISVKNLTTTPNRLPTKLTYSPDCSIVSKSPNFKITPSRERKVIATKTPSLQKRNSPKDARMCYTSGQQRTQARIPSGSNSPRFVKNSNLRYQTPKSVGRSQLTPKILKDRQTPRSGTSKKTPNSVNSRKKLEKVTPLNKTYSKKNRVPFSPKLGNAVLPKSYRNCMCKGIAIKLEESMYDEDVQTKCPPCHIQDSTIDRYSNRECGKMSEILAGHLNSWGNIEPTNVNESMQQIPQDNDSDRRVSVQNNLLPGLNRNHIQISGIKSLLTEESSMESLVGSKLFGVNVVSNGNSDICDINYDKKTVNKLQCKSRKSPINRVFHRYRSSTSSDTDRQTLSDYGSGNYSWSSNQFCDEESSCRTPWDPKIISEDSMQNEEDRQSTESATFSGTFMSCYGSFISVEEDYKYEDSEMGIVLWERRLRIPPPCVLSNMEPNKKSKPKSNCNTNSVDEIADYLKRELNIEEKPKVKGVKKKSSPASKNENLKKGAKYNPREDDNNATSDSVEYYIIKPLKNLEMGRKLEMEAFQGFTNPNENSKFARGNRTGQAPKKEFFNYLLLDSRVTQDLPRRGRNLSFADRWNIFCEAIFYVGKGKSNRPFSHFYSATPMYDKAVYTQIAEDEALTREACMIDALGLQNLKNEISGTYYGPALKWSSKDKCKLGTFLLQEALHIFMHEGERQIHRKHV
ncbi:uncharacterized protein LOC107269415 isoform X2 [Cephus cinctus]|uniref:Uncharacterized protein LOC107269415 isoform X2 n=1 Tax=Cephus cinctus TaxID=211228 RepID=A0AAJ7RKK7_CEPCN|nr:uncharacterized protein LOC107269415 isoform X2 [Cephus cinctus]